MPRHLPRRPARALQSSQIELDDNLWDRIEQAYGCSLPNAARLKMVNATNEFIAYAAAERHAQSTKDVRKRIEQIKRTARALLTMLETKGNDAALLAYDMIEQKFDGLNKLHGSAAVLAAICDQFVTEVEGATPHYRGSAWEKWVRDLTVIAERYNRPIGVRKDTDKRAEDTPSQFVGLVKVLQTLVPQEDRRHSHSSNALATAISRARRRRRVK